VVALDISHRKEIERRREKRERERKREREEILFFYICLFYSVNNH